MGRYYSGSGHNRLRWHGAYNRDPSNQTGRLNVTEKNETETISRRRAFSLLGLAALSLAMSPTILALSDAEAQQPSTTPGQTPRTGTATTPQTGTERRQERRGERTEHRQERRGERTERRQERRTEQRGERRGKRKKGPTERRKKPSGTTATPKTKP